jgi:hypothetical protein
MNKKIIAIVGLAALIAVSGGVISMTGDSFVRGTDFTRDSTVVSTDTATPTDWDIPETNPAPPEETDSSETDSPEQVQTDAYIDPGNDVNHYQDELVSVSSYSVKRVIDHTTDEDCTPREIFGKLYYYCRLSFYSDGKVELLLNPASDDLRTGRYSIYDDVVSVIYDDGSGAEFTILTDDIGEISYIVVNYGDFDVYFGQ